MTNEADTFLPAWSKAVGPAALGGGWLEQAVGRLLPPPMGLPSRPESPGAEGLQEPRWGAAKWGGALSMLLLPSRWPLSDAMNSVFAGGLLLVGFRGRARSAGTSQLQSRTAL